LVIVAGGQPNLQPSRAEQRVKLTKKTVVGPGERYEIIQRLADERAFNRDLYLKEFGITVDVNEMVILPARIYHHQKLNISHQV
jgi:hypothetical protein